MKHCLFVDVLTGKTSVNRVQMLRLSTVPSISVKIVEHLSGTSSILVGDGKIDNLFVREIC